MVGWDISGCLLYPARKYQGHECHSGILQASAVVCGKPCACLCSACDVHRRRNFHLLIAGFGNEISWPEFQSHAGIRRRIGVRDGAGRLFLQRAAYVCGDLRDGCRPRSGKRVFIFGTGISTFAGGASAFAAQHLVINRIIGGKKTFVFCSLVVVMSTIVGFLFGMMH